uniref:NrS-1 polymerase-like helicase domain-containing protein n=1 Tax=Phlegmariurus squarrosus TaxID=73615 RepID=H9M844_PHLSQ|nr:hypothetical protein HusqMp43 [Phlegmariurus squarrosus]AEV55751.1 hypothetical protein HusqMp43 [Phlegmariurus squarrosus]
MSWLEGQVFLYVQGPGGTGKSQLALILTALIGRENVVTTTLKDLNNNTFECSNLRGKKLILISDTERYGGDISILNQIVGRYSVRGMVKFIQGAYEVRIQGTVMIVGNAPLEVSDTSNALAIRMRLFHAENISNKREDLISYFPGGRVERTSGK